MKTTPSFALTHATAICGGCIVKAATIIVEDGIIRYIGEGSHDTGSLPVLDCAGKIVGPGLVDMHIHGCGGFGPQDLEGMSRFLQDHGVTSFQLATAMDLELLSDIQSTLRNNPSLLNNVIGVYPEGPFLAPQKKGGIPLDSLSEPDMVYLQQILDIQIDDRPLVSTMTLAPELPGMEEIMIKLKGEGVVVAWGHSQAYHDQLPTWKKTHLTHLFNAMVGLEHRRPGLAMLPFSNATTTYELICDYVHVHKDMIEFVIKQIGTKNMCLISDGMSFCGMGAGEATYLGKEMYCDGRACYYKDSGTLIGSALLVSDTARNLFKDGLIDIVQLFQIAATNPARVLGRNDIGMLEVGRYADMVLLDEDLSVARTFKRSL